MSKKNKVLDKVLGLPYNRYIKGYFMLLQNKESNLTSGLEDYIETIYMSHLNDTPLKGAELARQLCVSRASVSEALSKLVAKGLIRYNSYESIALTPQGIKEAKKVYNKHHILKKFFETVLDISSSEAGENACKIEHIISEHILREISKFTQYCEQNTQLLENYKKEK
jgi:DtxR family Mn-dependent transcriptional regulator